MITRNKEKAIGVEADTYGSGNKNQRPLCRYYLRLINHTTMLSVPGNSICEFTIPWIDGCCAVIDRYNAYSSELSISHEVEIV